MNTVDENCHSQTGALSALGFSLLMMVLCGLLYPAVTTLTAGALFPTQARGSLVLRDGAAVGSALVGQPFTGDRYFQGRPSAANYDPMAAAGSNLAPSNPALQERAATESQRIQQRDNIAAPQVPAELLAASGSGLDPHISPAAAEVQITRVATARNLDETAVRTLVAQFTEGPQFGLLGQPRVNVLLLNLALDQMSCTFHVTGCT